MSLKKSDFLDELDMKILSVLQEDARRSYREVAEITGVATQTVYNRLKRMTDEGVIKAYIPLLDPSRVGYDLTAVILVQVDGQFLVDVEKALAQYPEVHGVYDITGEFDIAILVRFRDRASLNGFIKSVLKMPHIKRTVTNVALNVVKEDPRLKLWSDNKAARKSTA